MSDESNFEIPDEIAALIPDEISSDQVSPQAQQTVAEIEQDFSNRAAKMIEAANKIPQAKVAINGIFKHPSEFTQEEWDIIVAGLRAHLPLYAIAMKVHCERHFLAKKIQENKEVAQLVLDSREGMVDETEFQLYKAARSGSMSAIMYLLDHLGQDRGYGEQSENKPQGEDVQITFGEISQSDLDEAKTKIEEANRRITPTLAGELAAMEVPKPVTAQELAIAEDMVNAIKNATESKPIDINPSTVTPPPYEEQNTAVEDRYEFLENAFAEGGDSPFGGFT